MSIIHETSTECSLSPLEWFCIPPTQTAVEKTYNVDYQPLTAIRSGAPIEFYIPASTEEYLDLKNTRLHVTCKIVKSDGTDCGATDVVAPVNDLFNSLWSNVELFLNDRLISHSNNTHGYTSIISHLIHDSEESLYSERATRLIYKDTAGSMDETAAKTENFDKLIKGFHLKENGTEVLDAAPGNDGLHQRYLHTRISQEVMLSGGLRIDLFEQNRYLPNGISMKLRFHRQKDAFVLMAAADEFKVEVTEAFITIRKVKVSPGILLGHTDAMMKSPAKFPITRKECKVLAIPNGFQSFVKDIFLGQLPKRVVIGMVHNTGFAGLVTKNPYNFEDFGINYMQLYTDGEPVQSKPLKLTSGKYLDAFEALSKSFDKFDGEKSSIIKREDWPRGYSLFAYDLTPDYDGDDHYPLIRHGNLRLEMNFAAAVSHTINIIVYAEFDNIIEISNNRNIQFDYTS